MQVSLNLFDLFDLMLFAKLNAGTTVLRRKPYYSSTK